MKKLYILLVVALATLSSTAQIIDFPDANFKAKLLVASPSNQIAQNLAGSFIKIDANNDGEIDVSEALNVRELKVYSGLINDLTGINYFTNLTLLWCQFNSLQNLDISNLTLLQELDCTSNQLTFINLDGFNNLRYLYCSYNLFTSLDITGLNIFSFVCDNNQLQTLIVNGQSNLLILSCKNNQLSSLDLTGLSYIGSLNFSNNLFTSIDLSNLTTIQGLYCSNNQLSQLNLDGLINIQILECDQNQLSTLDLSECTALFHIIASHNQLETIAFPSYFQTSLICDLSFNQFETLTFPTGNYDGLYCNDNLNLNFLSIKNIHGVAAGVTNDFFYNDFSNCPQLEYFCVDSSVSDWQNLMNNFNGYTNCLVGTYCNFTPGGTFYTIQGNIFLDNDSNGCDINDLALPNLNFTFTNGNITDTIIANETGVYFIPIQEGSYDLTPVLENPSYFTLSPTTISVSFPTEASPFLQDFCVTSNGVHNDVEVSILPIGVARPGFDATYKIIYKNKGNQVSNGSLSFSFDDARMDLVSALPVNTGSATNSLSWSYSSLNPFETREINLSFNINSPMETPAVNGGAILNYTAAIVGATDFMPIDNTFTLNQTVVNSYDPNDKTCLEGATITPSMVGQYVHYVIRFENTGTFPAQNVVVSDVIDATKFEIASLVPQSSSHSFVTRINSTTGKVDFIFENINLPFDDANNDGYIAFKIKTNSTLVLGNTFSNTANIYFDYNFPIVTNTATTTIAALSNQDFDFGSYFSVYPIPAKDVLHLAAKNEIGVKAINIYNTLGQMVLVVTNPENNAAIDVANLKTGTYFIKVITDRGTSNTKFIKE